MPQIIPGQLTETSNTGQSESQKSARERAISRLMGGQVNQAQATPVPNPSSISAEDAVNLTQATETQAQNTTNEALVATTEGEVKEQPKPSEADKSAKSEEPLSSQYAVLARKEKALRAKAQAQEQAYKAREAALAAKEAELKAREQDYATKYVPKDRLASDPYGAMTEAGLSYDDFTRLALNPPAPQDPRLTAEISALKAQIEELKGTTSKVNERFESQQQDSYKQAVKQITMEAQSLVKNDPAFEAIRETDSVSDVVELIEQTWKKDGILLTVEDAAAEVEEALTARLEKLAKLEKIQKRLQSQAQAAQQTTKQPEAKQQPQMKTLTNAVGTQRKLSAKERAILAFEGKLNKS